MTSPVVETKTIPEPVGVLKKKPKRKQRPKPYPANQYVLDPRQDLCWSLYIDPKSETFSNALRSGLKAGYPLSTSNQITTEIWWLEKVRQTSMAKKAERNLDKVLELPFETQVVGAFGPVIDKETKEPVMSYNHKLIKIVSDVSMFVAERLDKKRYGKVEDDIKPTVIVNIINPLQKIYGAGSADGNPPREVLPSSQG